MKPMVVRPSLNVNKLRHIEHRQSFATNFDYELENDGPLTGNTSLKCCQFKSLALKSAKSTLRLKNEATLESPAQVCLKMRHVLYLI